MKSHLSTKSVQIGLTKELTEALGASLKERASVRPVTATIHIVPFLKKMMN